MVKCKIFAKGLANELFIVGNHLDPNPVELSGEL